MPVDDNKPVKKLKLCLTFYFLYANLSCLSIKLKKIMKTKKQIERKIFETFTDYEHVLKSYPATTEINAPHALMQIQAKAILDTLYWVLNKQRPEYKCDDFTKLNY